MARSLNRVQLIGNLTRDPELKYTPSGSAVCTFGIATNRSWTTDTGEKKEEVDFHNIVAWRKLAEICSQYLAKGRKTYVEGRLSTRSWTGQDGQQKSRTEIVIENMIILDGRGGVGANQGEEEARSQRAAPKAKTEAGKVKKDKAVTLSSTPTIGINPGARVIGSEVICAFILLQQMASAPNVSHI